MSPGEIVLEKRKLPRLPVQVPVWCDALGPDASTQTVNLTPSGAYLETHSNPALDTAVELALCLPDGDMPMALAGRVVRSGSGPEEPAGVGIEFMAVDPGAHERLCDFVESMCADARW